VQPLVGRRPRDAACIWLAQDALALVERLRPLAVASARVAATPSGYDCRFLSALRALSPGGGGATPAIALTPWAGRDARLGILALGFSGHVGAPCSPEAVAAENSRLARGRATAAVNVDGER
jgi:hypothetical protein